MPIQEVHYAEYLKYSRFVVNRQSRKAFPKYIFRVNSKGGSSIQFLVWFMALVVPVVPLAVLDFPWWGIALYILLSSLLKLGAFVNPVMFLWALAVETQRIQSGRFDAISFVFFAAFCVYFAYWYLVYISPLSFNKLVLCILIILVIVIAFVPFSSASSQEQEITFKVAGVTFNNSDGSSRQQNLADLMAAYGAWYPIPCWFSEYRYERLPAYYVYVGSEIIGNIPANDVCTMQTIEDSIDESAVRISTFVNEEGRTIYYARVFASLEE